jgi:pilus assembly protein Flp/PilA
MNANAARPLIEWLRSNMRRNAMNRTKQLLKSLLNDECGQDLIEYALVASVLALGAVAAEGSLVTKIGNEFNMITNKF